MLICPYILIFDAVIIVLVMFEVIEFRCILKEGNANKLCAVAALTILGN